MGKVLLLVKAGHCADVGDAVNGKLHMIKGYTRIHMNRQEYTRKHMNTKEYNHSFCGETKMNMGIKVNVYSCQNIH